MKEENILNDKEVPYGKIMAFKSGTKEDENVWLLQVTLQKFFRAVEVYISFKLFRNCWAT